MRTLLSRYARSRHGTAAIEFCLVAPVMLTLYAGVTEFGSIFKVYYQVSRLSSQYAMAWSDCSDQPAGNCKTELGTYTTNAAIANIAPALSTSAVTLQMFQFQLNGSTPTVSYAYPTGGSMTAAQTTIAQSGAVGNGQIGVLVTVSYQHQLKYFQKLTNPFLSSYLNPSYTVVQLKS